MFGSSEQLSRKVVKDIAHHVLLKGSNVLISATPGCGRHTIVDHLSSTLRARGVAAAALPLLHPSPSDNPYKFVPGGRRLDVYCGALENPWLLHHSHVPKQFLMWHDPRFPVSNRAKMILESLRQVEVFSLGFGTGDINHNDLPFALSNSKAEVASINGEGCSNLGEGSVSSDLFFVESYAPGVNSCFVLDRLPIPPKEGHMEHVFKVERAIVREVGDSTLLALSPPSNPEADCKRLQRYFNTDVTVVDPGTAFHLAEPTIPAGCPALLWGIELCEVEGYTDIRKVSVNVNSQTGKKKVPIIDSYSTPHVEDLSDVVLGRQATFPLEVAFAFTNQAFNTTDLCWAIHRNNTFG